MAAHDSIHVYFVPIFIKEFFITEQWIVSQIISFHHLVKTIFIHFTIHGFKRINVRLTLNFQIQPLKYLMISQVESVLHRRIFHLPLHLYEMNMESQLGFKQKDTDGHGFGHKLGFPLMHKESFSFLLNC